MGRIAITGGIGEGKSTVLGYLRDLGFSVASSDDFAREVFKSPHIQRSIADLIGVPPPVPPETLREHLSESRIRRAVNRLTHPAILAEIDRNPASCVEVPLLVEACLYGEFDRVWVVTCGAREQLRRVASRLGSIEEASAIVRTQLTSRAKIPFADRVVRTNRDESSVKRCVALAAQRDLR